MAKKKATISNVQAQFIIAEYNALNNEILKRGEYRYQIISLTLVIAGTILTFGLQPTSPAYVLFVFPILACFLSAIWAHNVVAPRYIGSYIGRELREKYGFFGWGKEMQDKQYSFSWITGILASSGLFIGTEITTLLLGLFRSSFSTLDMILIVFDGVAILITLIALRSATVKPQ